jgi:hypothetical protein
VTLITGLPVREAAPLANASGPTRLSNGSNRIQVRPLFAPKSDPSDRAKTGVAKPHIAEQSRTWRAVGRAVGYARFLKRQLSLPVSMMSQWCVSRSSMAVVILASPNTCGQSAKARLVVISSDMFS